MTRTEFRTVDGNGVTAITAAEMREVDRVAVEEVGLELLQMMENAGRALAWHVRDIRDDAGGVVIAAGNGGNGGGGMASARHLANRGVAVRVVLDRAPSELTGAAAHQARILDEMSVPITTGTEELAGADWSPVVVDALIGYGIAGEVRPPASDYIEALNSRSEPVVSLDVPSGLDATTGDTHGIRARPDRTVTLALPKTGLHAVENDLYLADIGIPNVVFHRLDIAYNSPFSDGDWVELERSGPDGQ
ncbi:NAD(P)H-hydrate epimerase [Halobellus marinus]|uniref:NAD(P)H-hydrate epimerase n=1 Tax=Halobellus TaxID=1073986 RepID=UPI0028AA8249|nr:NAD(P)H-hydrate epimerase [Halobellus sp. DFY28]